MGGICRRVWASGRRLMRARAGCGQSCWYIMIITARSPRVGAAATARETKSCNKRVRERARADAAGISGDGGTVNGNGGELRGSPWASGDVDLIFN